MKNCKEQFPTCSGRLIIYTLVHHGLGPVPVVGRAAVGRRLRVVGQLSGHVTAWMESWEELLTLNIRDETETEIEKKVETEIKTETDLHKRQRQSFYGADILINIEL